MKELSSLLAGMPYEVLRGSADRRVRGIVCHSDKITKDCLFVCIRGQKTNGHQFAKRAAQAQAAAIVAEELCELPQDCETTLIKVADTRKAFADLAHAYYGYPAKKLVTVAITGTKGKTTTACMIMSILRNAGIRTGYIGTLGIDCGYGMSESTHTTPEADTVAGAFRQMADGGCKAAIVEASSIGLKQERLCGIRFDIGVFLNFGDDHIGGEEHADMEEYLSCKAKLLRQCMIGILNADEKCSAVVAKTAACREIHYFGSGHGISAASVRRECMKSALGTSFQIPAFSQRRFQLPLPGMFNVENALAAAAVCKQMRLSPQEIRCGLMRVSVPGRMENVPVGGGYRVFIDYAHNAMALEQVLLTLREYCPERLVCLFGCGGNRSKTRRLQMGEVSGRLADFSIVTSDNPRNEDPDAIIDDILEGMKQTDGRYVRITDRREAIAYALSHARKGDVILLAGKGHEVYQEVRGTYLPMDERKIIREQKG